MRFEYLVLLIIAFNVITAVLQRRAKKAREAAGQGQAPETRGGAGETWSDEEDEEDAYEASRRREAVRGAESRSPAAAGEEPVERMPSLGRDIFDQIMRDLGLKVPGPATPPAPAPVPASRDAVREPVEDAAARRARLQRRERELEAESARAKEKIKEWERLATSRSRNVEAPASRSPAAPARAVRAPVVMTAPVPASAGVDLRDPRRLREALIAKEILDAPLARRPRRAHP